MASIAGSSHTQVERSKTNIALSTPAADFGSTPGNPATASPLSQSIAQQNWGKFNEEWEAPARPQSTNMERTSSVLSQGDSIMPSRAGTLKKKSSIKRTGSLKRSSSKRSSYAGSVRSLALQTSADTDEMQSAFYTPVPTTGNPTEILANRFQAWRKVLKDLITYFREIQASYDHRAKNLLKISNVVNNTTTPNVFLESGGIDDALQILRGYHKGAIAEANKSKDIEDDVILALVGLRSDLQQKIKEIKNLSGDFKNSVDKEMENTKRAVNNLQEGLGQSDVEPAGMIGKQDPYLLRLAVDRQVEKQIDEENYLHQAYLNLEASGRELESIIVGEIQKSYNAYAGILKREAEAAYSVVEALRTGPIDMPKDHEWKAFVEKDQHFVDPSIPVRQAQRIQYPGRDNELAQEVRAGLLERKSKYLKSYTPGWYVLSPTHLHEFKSADKAQAPVMSLFLPEQKLGSHSTEGGSSNKFMLKGRQTGAMHRGHSWVFRAESYETMLAWFEDIKTLTEKSPQERSAFVRKHARSVSGTSQKAGSISSDGIMDEEDDEPFAASASAVAVQGAKQDVLSKRPQPGGRFPSTDLIITPERGLQAPLSPSSGSSGFGDVQDRDIAAASALPGREIGLHYGAEDPSHSPTHAAMVNQYAQQDGINPYTDQPIHNNTHVPTEQASTGLAATGLNGAAMGVFGSGPYSQHGQDKPAIFMGQAAFESAKIAKSDTDAQNLEAQAAREAALVASPGNLHDIPSDDNFMSGGRSTGGLREFDGSTTSQAGGSSHPIGAASTPLITKTQPPSAAQKSDKRMQPVSQLHVPGEFPKHTLA